MKDDLLQDVDTLRKAFEIKVKRRFDIKKQLAIKTEECIEMLEKKKDGLVNYINRMVKEAKGLKKDTEHQLEEDISLFEGNLAWANKIKQGIESDVDVENRKDLMSCIRSVKQMAESRDQALTTAKSYVYPVYHRSKASAESVLGSIDRAEMLEDEIPNVGPKARSITDASMFKCTGKIAFMILIIIYILGT